MTIRTQFLRTVSAGAVIAASLCPTATGQPTATPGSSLQESNIVKVRRATELSILADQLLEDGKASDAILKAEEALEIRQEVLGVESADTANSLAQLAHLWRIQGELEKAIPYQIDYLAALEQSLGEQGTHFTIATQNLAQLYSEQGDIESAIEANIRALRLRRTALPNETLPLAQLLDLLGMLQNQQGRPREARVYLLEAKALLEDSEQTYVSDLAHLQVHLGRSSQMDADYSQTVNHYEAAAALFLEAGGEEIQNAGLVLRGLGDVLVELGDLARAKPAYLQSLTILERDFATNQEAVLHVVDSLIQISESSGSSEETIAQLEKKISILENYGSSDSATLWEDYNRLGTALLAKGELNEAEEAYNRALEVLQEDTGSHELERATSLLNMAEVYRAQGKHQDALSLVQQALTIRRDYLGNDSPDTAMALNSLAVQYQEAGMLDEAAGAYIEAMEILDRLPGHNDLNISLVLHNLGTLMERTGDYPTAEEHLLRALELRKTLLGNEHPDVAHTQNSLGSVYSALGNFDSAKARYQKALFVQRKILGEDHPDVAVTLNNLASLLTDTGEFSKAFLLQEEALRIEMEAYGETHPAIARDLGNLAHIYTEQAQHQEAVSLYRQALDIYLQTFGPDHPDTGIGFSNLGNSYQSLGRYDEAEELYLEADRIFLESYGRDHPLVALTKNNLGSLSFERGDLETALVLEEEALEIRRKILGNDHPDVAMSLNNHAGTYRTLGRYPEAIQLFNESLGLYRAAFGPQHPDSILVLHNLGSLYAELGDHLRAEEMLEEAFVLSREILGPDHSQVARTAGELGALYSRMGDYGRALHRFSMELEIRKRTFGDRHPAVALSLNNVATVHLEIGDLERAEPLLREALSIQEDLLGSKHSAVGTTVGNLALLTQLDGKSKESIALHRRAVGISSQSLGPSHPRTAFRKRELAGALLRFNKYREAEGLLRESISIQAEILGELNHETAVSLLYLAETLWAQGSLDGAFEALSRALQAQDVLLARLLVSGSEQQKLTFASTLRQSTSTVVSFALEASSENRAADQLAAKTVFRRKGRVLDALSGAIVRFRESVDESQQAILKQWSAVLAREAAIAGASATFPDADSYADALIEIQAHREYLERTISKWDVPRDFSPHLLDVSEVQLELEKDEVLVDYVAYLPFQPGGIPDESSELRYAAVVMGHEGPAELIDIGAVAEVDKDLRSFLIASRNPVTRWRPPAMRAHKRLIDPLEEKLVNARHLFIVPDSLISLVPFEALVGSEDHPLIEKYRISYLASARDLVGRSNERSRDGDVLILAGPNYGSASSPRPAQVNEALSTEGAPPQLSRDFGGTVFSELPGAAAEGRALLGLVKEATLLVGDQATEQALKSAASPSVLHLATHAFFLPNEAGPAHWEDVRSARSAKRLENPLIRSGLALAGANHGGVGTEDGILTALEVSSLDLQSTQLVVMSACETGLGEIFPGEGVFGLRRALQLAGARSQVMSLWKVADEATRDFMTSFYAHLSENWGVLESIHTAKLEMVADLELSHPYFWASFVLIGDTGPVDFGAALGGPVASARASHLPTLGSHWDANAMPSPETEWWSSEKAN